MVFEQSENEHFFCAFTEIFIIFFMKKIIVALFFLLAYALFLAKKDVRTKVLTSFR